MSDEKEKETPIEEQQPENKEAPDEVNENVKEEDNPSDKKDEESQEEITPSPEEDTDNKEPEAEPTKEDEITIDKAKEATVDTATTVLKDKGFDYAELQKEFNEKGEISKETRERLSEVGITDEILDNYIEGQKARVERELDEISLCIGGRETMNEVIKWASQNISDDEKASINKITDANVMKIVLKDLKNRMEEKEGKLPETQLNGEGGKPAVEMFESQAQMFEAIKDPRYKTDEVYRAKVMKKIQASREAGIDLGI